VKNMLEETVAQEYERLRPTMKGFCGCHQCRDDVLVYALNRLAPRYVSAREGEVISGVALQGEQPKADVSIMLLEAFRRVASAPRHGHGGPLPGG
jgi:competence protein ComFB